MKSERQAMPEAIQTLINSGDVYAPCAVSDKEPHCSLISCGTEVACSESQRITLTGTKK